MNNAEYIRLQKVPLDKIMPLIGVTEALFEVAKNRTITLRLGGKRVLFFKKQQKCACCGLKATHFWIEKTRTCTADKYHVNMYAATRDGGEEMLTIDHIKPVSKGGKNEHSNYQLLCRRCNQTKGNMVVSLDRLRNIVNGSLPKINQLTHRKKHAPAVIRLTRCIYKVLPKPLESLTEKNVWSDVMFFPYGQVLPFLGTESVVIYKALAEKHWSRFKVDMSQPLFTTVKHVPHCACCHDPVIGVMITRRKKESGNKYCVFPISSKKLRMFEAKVKEEGKKKRVVLCKTCFDKRESIVSKPNSGVPNLHQLRLAAG